MNEQPRTPRVVHLVPGKLNVPEPHRADYSADIPEEMYELIDELCPQDKLTSGKNVKRFRW